MRGGGHAWHIAMQAWWVGCRVCGLCQHNYCRMDWWMDGFIPRWKIPSRSSADGTGRLIPVALRKEEVLVKLEDLHRLLGE